MFSQWNFHNLLMSHISGWNMKKLAIKSWYYAFLPVYIGVTHRTTDKTIFSWNDQPHKILLFMLCLFSLMVLDEAHLYEIICVFTDTQYFFHTSLLTKQDSDDTPLGLFEDLKVLWKKMLCIRRISKSTSHKVYVKRIQNKKRKT